MLSLDTDVTWQYDAACLGYVARNGEDPFFQGEPRQRGQPSRLKQARLLCSMCRVKEQCLKFAVENDCAGIWAGTTESQRRRLVLRAQEERKNIPS
jgi:hypothetical protein